MPDSGYTSVSLDAFWVPYTSNRLFKRDPRIIVGADGCHYITAEGRRVFDSLSGLWCCGFGHNRPEIAAAVSRQLETLDYSPAFQFAHPQAFELAERVAGLLPEPLDRVFFTNSGSESVETALKIAKAYWRLRGRPEKSLLVGRVRGYHGANFGGTSVGGIETNRTPFGDLAVAEHLPTTLLPENAFSRGLPPHGIELADVLEAIVERHGADRIAAVIVEPVSGSGGVVVPPAGYLKRLRELCTAHDILLIFDEVITGFGRTGKPFGIDTFGAVPDLLCIAKALTNGTVPMGAVIADRAIYDAFLDSDLPDYIPELTHGYTYSGHPVACAAGLAAIDIFERDGIAQRAAELAPVFEDALHALRGTKHITDIRNCGLAGALQIDPLPDDPLRRPFEIGIKCWQRGVYVRWAGDTVQLAPPFVSQPADIEDACNILLDVIPTVE
jgi:beta-alanine--pyruvate transaminase